MMGEPDWDQVRAELAVRGNDTRFDDPDPLPWPLMYLFLACEMMARVIGTMALVVLVVVPLCAVVWLYGLGPVWSAMDFAGPFQGVVFVLVLFVAFMMLCGVLTAASELRWRWQCARWARRSGK
ncbi:MAG: hypothetical protein OXK77_14070 [Gemmatimonadota bacterium]|nr:hypothetical protein [Gemmatimonadota bacterium]MDE2865276.1 hypothetical protein [Gemmatimonadota bacterium]